jgi:hypothetical protein
LPLINTKVPLKDKLELVHKFFKEVWGSDLIKDDRPEPPTIEQMDRSISEATFPALKILELENWWDRARMFYYMKGDKSMLHMDGDPDPEEEKRKIIEAQERENQLWKAMKEGDYDKVDELEKGRAFRYVKFPREIAEEHEGIFESYENDVLTIRKANDEAVSFNPTKGSDPRENFDISKPLIITTTYFTNKSKREEPVPARPELVKITSIRQ